MNDDQIGRAAKVALLRTLADDLAKVADAQGMAPAKIRISVARGLSLKDVERWAEFDINGQPRVAARREWLIAQWDRQRVESLRSSLWRRQQ